MASCKDCLCVDVCKMRSDIVSADYYPEILKKKFEEECNCPHFKDRTRFMELPCNVGDTVYYLATKFEKKGRKKVDIEFVESGIVDNILLGQKLNGQAVVCVASAYIWKNVLIGSIC